MPDPGLGAVHQMLTLPGEAELRKLRPSKIKQFVCSYTVGSRSVKIQSQAACKGRGGSAEREEKGESGQGSRGDTWYSMGGA